MALADNYEPTKDLGDASTVVYTADWNPISTDYVSCYFEDVTTGVQTLQTGVTFEKLSNDTLKATLPSAATSSYYVILSRDVPAVQGQSYTTSSGFPAKTVESTFDKTVGMIQGFAEGLDRSITLPVGSSSSISTELPPPESGKYIGWNEDEDALQNYTPAEIDENNIADGSISTAKLANDAVDSTKLADNSVDSEHIVDGAVDSDELASDSVSTVKIEDNAVTPAKLEDDLVFDQFPSTPSSAPDSNYEVANKKYVDDEIDNIPSSFIPMIELVDSDSFSGDNEFSVSEAGSNGESYKFTAEWLSNNQSSSSILLIFNNDTSGDNYTYLYSDLTGDSSSPSEDYINSDGSNGIPLAGKGEGYSKLEVELSNIDSKVLGTYTFTVIKNGDYDSDNHVIKGSFIYDGGALSSIKVIDSNTNVTFAGRYSLGKYRQS